MIYVYGIISILVGGLLALKGMSNYRLFLSASVAISQAITYLGLADFQPDLVSPTTAIIAALVGGAITFVFYRWITYVWTYVFFWYCTFIVSFLVIDPTTSGGLVIGSWFLLPLVITFLIRKQIKPMLIGLLSGFSVGMGVTIILVATMISNADMNSDFMTMVKLPAIALLALTLGGVAFQYFFVLKKNPELATV